MTKPVPRRPTGYRCNRTDEDNDDVLPSTVPIVGLGCSSFSTFFWADQPSDAKAWAPEALQRDHPAVREWIDTIKHAVQECGINLLDTAPWYGHGTSEVVIGWAMEELLGDASRPTRRKDLIINTKVGRYEAEPEKQFDFSYDTTILSVERSLQRMKCEYIDILQLHDPEFAPTLNVLVEETIPAMIECKKRGYCRGLGMTGYPLKVQRQILEASFEKFGEEIFDQSLTYGHYNLHDKSLVEGPFASYCEQHKLVLMTAAPLSMGLLTHQGPPEWHPAPSKLKDACHQAAQLCEAANVDIPSLAMVVALSKLEIPCTLLGMKNIEQVDFAHSLASRFVSLDCDSSESLLSQVLTEKEADVYKRLSDTEIGPFASVWKSDEFEWDGVEDAHRFWAEQQASAKWEKWQDR